MTRLNIKPAASSLSNHKFDVSTIASLDFGELLPTRVIETVKRDNFKKVSAKGILRLAPQVFPTFGKCYVKSAAFYVPEYQIFEASDAFHTNMNTWKGNAVKLPYMDSVVFNEFFANSSYSSIVTTISGPTISTAPAYGTYDFVVIKSNSDFEYRKLTRVGQSIYKIFKALGYDFTCFSFETGFTRSDIIATGSYNMNMLPFLAYLKVYTDYFLNPNFYNSSPIVACLNAIQYGKSYVNNGTTWFDSSSGLIYANFITACLGVIQAVPFQRTLYTDAWNSPNSPDGLSPASGMVAANSTGLISPYEFDSSSYPAQTDRLASSTQSSILTTSGGAALNGLSAFGLKLLQGFDKFVRRRNISGNKAVERIYSMFGIKSDFFSSHYCHKLFEGSSRIDFSPVLSNTDSVSGANGKVLGAYAGFASTGLDYTFSHKCDSYGYIICLSWIQIVPMNLHGVSPSILRKFPNDFYTPEFDGTTVRAVPQIEVNNPSSGVAKPSLGNSALKPFGFINLYDDYRNMKDSIVGDFVVSSNAKHFLLCRDLGVLSNYAYSLKAQSDIVHYMTPLDSNPTIPDIFAMSNTLGDRFYLQLDFEIIADRPIKSESDAIDLNGEGELSFSMNGNSMS